MAKRSIAISQDEFEQEVRLAQERFHIILEQADQIPGAKGELLVAALVDLSVALEELHVAAEEIQTQNEQLITIHYAVEVERQRYQELFELAPDAYLLTDINGIIQESNQAAAILLQLQQQHIIGKPLAVLVAIQDRSSFRAKLRQLSQVLSQRQSLQDWEVCLQPRQGVSFPGAIAVSAAHNPQHQLVGLRWLIRDITEQKQTETELRRLLAKEQELNDLKSRFIDTISHEYRTPLTRISLSAWLLETVSDLPALKRAGYFREIKTNVKWMTGLVEEVLEFGQAKARKLLFKPAPLNLETLCRQLVEDTQLGVVDDTQIMFACQGICVNEVMDGRLLRQIVGNLLSNALKYSPPDTVIQVDLTCEDSVATLQIQDQGIGIPVEDMPNLFEPFHRGSNVERVPGTGMGLAIVKKAVELHEGTISVESAVDIGTTFRVLLPLHPNMPDSPPTVNEADQAD